MRRPQHRSDGVSEVLSHLASIDELERAERGLEVGSVGLEFVERGCEVALELGGVLP